MQHVDRAEEESWMLWKEVTPKRLKCVDGWREIFLHVSYKKKKKKSSISNFSSLYLFLHSLAKKFKSSLKYSHWLQRRSLHSWRMILLINWFQEYYTRGLVDEHHKDRLWCSTEEKKKRSLSESFLFFFLAFQNSIIFLHIYVDLGSSWYFFMT